MALTTQTALTKAKYYQEICAPYTNGGFDRYKRHFSYVNSQGIMPVLHKATATLIISTCAWKGAAVGASIGFTAGTKLSGDLQVVKVTTGLGFVTGASIGAAGGAYIYVNGAEQFRPYNDWTKTKVNCLLKEAIQVDNPTDEVLKEFICPIGLVVMDWPTRTPAGHRYEKIEILKNRAGSNTIKDPMRNGVFDETALKDDFEATYIINKRTIYLLQSYANAMEKADKVKEGLSSLIRDFENIAKFSFEDAKNVIEERRIDSENIERYMDELKAFFKTFGNSHKNELDWSVNWKKTLDDRWKYFNPDAVILG